MKEIALFGWWHHGQSYHSSTPIILHLWRVKELPWHPNLDIALRVPANYNENCLTGFLKQISNRKTICCAGDRCRLHLGELLTTLLLPSSLGWEQAQCIWSWAWRWVGNTEPLQSRRHGGWRLYDQIDIEPSLYRGLDIYLSVKQITEYTSDEPWGWYQPPPSKMWVSGREDFSSVPLE